MRRRFVRILLFVGVIVVGLAAVLSLTGLSLLRGSRARLTGERGVPGLEAVVAVQRDAIGVPCIVADHRDDGVRALGYLHAQERFFQMDLMRRAAAGELAGLLGPSQLPVDRDTRRHRFRTRALDVVTALDERSRGTLHAYVEGVNAGLDDLRVRPFEYLALRQKPQPWRPEDTVLTICAMFLDLGLSTADSDAAAGIVHDTLPPALAAFLLPVAAHWDAPLKEGPPLPPAMPDSQSIDLRAPLFSAATRTATRELAYEPVPVTDAAGSNNWAVAGRLTGHGGALLANDMHLSLALPNIWYRAQLRIKTGDGNNRDAVGVTLPGAPAIVAGSNGNIAWGFTNSYADCLDLVILKMDPTDTTRYRTPDGWDRLRRLPEVIAVAGQAPDTLWVEESRWGPVWSHDGAGRPMVLRWTAHDPGSINLKLLDMVDADNVDEAVLLAAEAGIPAQNFVCADRDGRIAWTIAGRLPHRAGWDGRRPVSWADGACRWDGWRPATGQPHLVDPPEGRLWTANNRVTGGDDLKIIGDGGYGLGARAQQIRDGLRALDRPVEKDMLALQLDDRALFLESWRELALTTLANSEAPIDSAAAASRAEFAHLVRDDWDGHASIASAGYRLVRAFSHALVDRIYSTLTAPCLQASANFDARSLPWRQAVAWELVVRRPAHLLPPPCADWDELILLAVDDVTALVAKSGLPASAWIWGGRNTVDIAHPLLMVAPPLRRWLAAPAQALPGDSNMPRVQHPRSGSSERLVVSPGREADGILHMPGGQSGHPLSPFFLSGHDACAAGAATPLLPGPARYELKLVPR